MALGVSFRVFLPEGSSEGVRLVSKSNWTGIALACSRSRYATVRNTRAELRSPGVYILVGPAEGAKADARIYVGEGEDPRSRLDSHHSNKDFWTRLVLFTTSGQQLLNKGTIRYLEARLIELGAASGRAELENGTAPARPPLSEPDQQDAESFLADILLICPLLDIRVFEPIEYVEDAPRLYLKGPDASGEGMETDDGFLVYAGAKARVATVPSWPPWAEVLRRQLLGDGTLKVDPDGLSFTLDSDFEFGSPTAAAAALLGRSAAGPVEWRDSTGTPLRQLREAVVSQP
jgi:hypothetical protein